MKKLILVALLISSSFAQATDIILSSGIKNSLRSKIEKDLAILENFKFQPASAETLELLGIKELNASTATKWLEKRIKYIVEENATTSIIKLRLKKAIFIEREGVVFPNTEILPHSSALNKETSEVDNSHVVMSNIGAALYYGGKTEKVVYGMKISRGLLRSPLKVLAESPRIGIIQIGDGLFGEYVTLNPNNLDSIANTIARLAVFFHEARHSDGNGKSLTFMHSACPASIRDYAGQPACDDSLNGSYATSVAFLKEATKSCDSCKEREKEMLTLMMIDYQSRIINKAPDGTPATKWDPTPESL